MVRDAAEQEQRAREAALQRAQQLQMARESQAFSSREAAEQRAFDADKLAQMQGWESEKMDKQSESEKSRLELMNKLESERWEAQNEKLRKQNEEDYARKKYDRAAEIAAAAGVEFSDGWTADELLSGAAAQGNYIKNKSEKDSIDAKIAALGEFKEGMDPKFRVLAETAKKNNEYEQKREAAKLGLLRKDDDPIYEEHPELKEMNEIMQAKREEERGVKKQENEIKFLQVDSHNQQQARKLAAAEAARAAKAAELANRPMSPDQIAQLEDEAFDRIYKPMRRRANDLFGITEETDAESTKPTTQAAPLVRSMGAVVPKAFSTYDPDVAADAIKKASGAYKQGMAISAPPNIPSWIPTPIPAYDFGYNFMDARRNYAEEMLRNQLAGLPYTSTERVTEMERQRLQANSPENTPWYARWFQPEQPIYK
jgi:hypothetical protein